MITMSIPYQFIKQRVPLCWREIAFGLERQFIKPKVAIEKAAEYRSRGDSVSRKVIELASLREDESVADLVSSLSQDEPPLTDESVKAKWLYLVLAWLFENRESLSDPLGMVEEVYSDFAYPQEMASFVRYMPMEGPDMGSHERNVARLFDRWKAYIERAGKTYA